MGEIIDVLIVGAGPVGLVCALLLGRDGHNVRVIERGSQRCPFSRAFGVSSRTMELLGLVDMADGYLKHGRTPHCVRHRFLNSEVTWHLEISVPGCLHPTVILSQAKQEEILEKELEEAVGIRVQRGWELLALDQSLTDTSVTCTLQRDDGDDHEVVEARYVVGADGGRSTTRHLLDIPFEGCLDRSVIWLADYPDETDECDERIVADVYHCRQGRMIKFQLAPGQSRYILFMPGCKTSETPTAEMFKAEVEARSLSLNSPIRLTTPSWVTSLQFNYRVASTYRKGRVFLAGDAAHVHSPVGGQGMNMGVQDAMNLCWRLSSVLRGECPPGILAGYEQERRPVALSTVSNTHRATSVFFRHQSCLHSCAVRGFAFIASRSARIRHMVVRSLLQLDLHYPTGRQSWRGVDTQAMPYGDCGPGRRCPNVRLLGPPATTKALAHNSLHDRIKAGGDAKPPKLFTLVYFDGVAQEQTDDAQWNEIETTSVGNPFNLVRVCFSSAKSLTSPKMVTTADCLVTRALFVRAECEAAYIVRRDLVVAYRMRPVNLLRLASVAADLPSLV